MVRVLKDGRASELAIREARRMHCDICAEKRAAQTPATDNSETSAGFQRTCRTGHFEFASLGRCNEIGEMFEHCVMELCFR